MPTHPTQVCVSLRRAVANSGRLNARGPNFEKNGLTTWLELVPTIKRCDVAAKRIVHFESGNGKVENRIVLRELFLYGTVAPNSTTASLCECEACSGQWGEDDCDCLCLWNVERKGVGAKLANGGVEALQGM